jgi:hypothetical protein
MGANMTVPVPLFDVITKQLNVTGSFRYGAGDYPLAISLVERGLVDLKPLVTQRDDFTDALEAFEMTRKGKVDGGNVSLFIAVCRREKGRRGKRGYELIGIARYQVYHPTTTVITQWEQISRIHSHEKSKISSKGCKFWFTSF